MERCENCSEILIEKKYKNTKRLKCMSCGFETSTKEEEKEMLEFIENIKESNSKHYPQNEENED